MFMRYKFAIALVIGADLHVVNSSLDTERHLASRAHEIFDKLTPEKIENAVPLELTLDNISYVHNDKSTRLRGKGTDQTSHKHHKKVKKRGKRNNRRVLKDSDNKENEPSALNEVVDDSDWPYAGQIQSATGRILFQFSSNQVYKCSGTVIEDGVEGRSIVLTAAHCAYNDLSKEFASMAIFIPDQDGTRGSKSDFNCDNDVYGCWILSFAVVERGWTLKSFPYNVGYDYAYYVVHDRHSTHRGGYIENITGILDQDVVPMQIDFDAKLKDDYTVALGYSDENDPSFSYCSNKLDSINGIEDYTNAWLSNCGMHGGASGGPWLVDMDDSGVGTVVSLSSWGYSSSIGVAGPSLHTESGSFAECLFEKAKNATDPGSIGGYIVDC